MLGLSHSFRMAFSVVFSASWLYHGLCACFRDSRQYFLTLINRVFVLLCCVVVCYGLVCRVMQFCCVRVVLYCVVLGCVVSCCVVSCCVFDIFS